MGSQQQGAPVVEFRAFRGTRKTSVYLDHALDAPDFGRIVAAARARRLDVLASLVAGDGRELDKGAARRLAREADSLRRAVDLPQLDADLAAIAEVARFCARATGKAWLTVDGV